MQARSELAQDMSNKRHSVIDEESDEDRPTEVFADAQTLLRERNQSV